MRVCGYRPKNNCFKETVNIATVNTATGNIFIQFILQLVHQQSCGSCSLSHFFSFVSSLTLPCETEKLKTKLKTNLKKTICDLFNAISGKLQTIP